MAAVYIWDCRGGGARGGGAHGALEECTDSEWECYFLSDLDIFCNEYLRNST